MIFEPGRLIAGNAGILVTRVIYLKEGDVRNFVIVDAAMNDLIRPTLYDAYHEVRPVEVKAAIEPRIVADVVGPVCETGDLTLERGMQRPAAGDLLAIGSAEPMARFCRVRIAGCWSPKCWCTRIATMSCGRDAVMRNCSR